jgi:hypothetical protein
MLYKPFIEVLDKILLKRTELFDCLIVERVVTKRYVLSKLDLIVVRPIRRQLIRFCLKEDLN